MAEEIYSAAVHAVGAVFGIAALAVLVTFSALYKDAWAVVANSIYGASIIIMYMASTLYHAIPNEKARPVLKKLDHIAIYYLIAGSYTPFLLVTLRGALGWTLFGIIWFLAIAGTVIKLCVPTNGAKFWSVGMYLGMGWMAVFAIVPLVRAMPTISLIVLIVGGLSYTFGVIFYVWKSKAYTHAIWHFFVLAGTILQFFAILFACAL